MAQVIHPNAALLGATFVVICMLLQRPYEIFAAIPDPEPARLDEDVDRINPILNERIALLDHDLMTSSLEYPKV